MRHLATLALALLLGPAVAGAGEKPSAVPELTETHTNASKTVRLHTPPGWKVESRPGELDVLEARGDGLLLRVLRRQGELGLDSLHVECMLVRLAGAMEAAPQVDYEYDFVGGEVGGRRALDSAFVVHYDAPIEGHADWRQRNVTVVGDGESVCVIGYVPAAVYKKSKPARNLLKAVLERVELAPWP